MTLLHRLAYAFWHPVLCTVVLLLSFRHMDTTMKSLLGLSWFVGLTMFALSYLSEETQRLIAKCALGLFVATFVAAFFYFKKPEPRRSYSGADTELEESPAAIEKASREAADQWSNARR